MANLETLELTISANAESASQGIRSLSRSLSSLSRSIAKHIGNIEQLATALQNIKTATDGLNVGGALKGFRSSGGGKKTTKVTSSATPLVATWGDMPTSYGSATRYSNNGLYSWKGANIKRWNFQAGSAGAFTSVGANPQYYYPVGKAPAAKEVQQMDEMLKRNGGLADVKGKASEVMDSFNQMGNAAEETGKKTSKAFGRIAKIASTMLLRTALRSIMKAFGESWEAMYKYSNAMGGDFAKSIDALKASLQGAATSILSAFTPALVALTPVINVVASAIRYLCQGIQWLMSLLGMSTEFLGASTDAINKYTGASGGAGKANKEMLASFDELNVISSQSGGGGGGGSGIKTGLFSDQISEELAAISLIVSESLLAVGLILAFTGHPVIGTALMAVGAAGMVQAVATGWNMSDRIKEQLSNIMALFAGAEIAVGLILAFGGMHGLGIGLIAAGVANLVGSIALSWNLGNKVEAILKNLDLVVAGAFMGVGALLVLTGASPGVGFALIARGALKLVSELGEQWGIDDKIMGIIHAIEGVMNVAFLALGAILLLSGASPGLGLGLLVAGGVGLAAEVAPNWEENKNKVIGAMTEIAANIVFKWFAIKTSISNAWNTLMTWADITLLEPIRTAWNSIRNFFIMLFGSKEVSGSIAWWANKAWNIIAMWWQEGIAEPIKTAWNAVKSFFMTLFGSKEIQGSIAWWANRAWTSVSDWWQTTIVDNIKRVWNQVKGFFLIVFGSKEITGSIAYYANRAWTIIKYWWETQVYDKISSAWKGITDFFASVFKPIEDAWNFLQKIIEVTSIKITLTLNTQFDDGMKALLGLLPGANNVSEETRNSLLDIALHFLRNQFATGGFPTEGQLFIAREAGAELVGSMNGHTAVANNDQIVEGIASGVRQAEQEQNELLRQQNSLLRQILQKDSSFGASVALGRTVKQSLEMYNTVGG